VKVSTVHCAETNVTRPPRKSARMVICAPHPSPTFAAAPATMPPTRRVTDLQSVTVHHQLFAEAYAT
jgi:hypothetical protein